MAFNSVFFPTGTYTVTRTEAGSYDNDGIYTPGDQSEIDIVADVQAVAPNDGAHGGGRLLRDMPEGKRAEDTVVIYTLSELRALDPETESDVIEVDGVLFRVFKVQRFRVFANRYRAWAERIAA